VTVEGVDVQKKKYSLQYTLKVWGGQVLHVELQMSCYFT